MRWLWTLGGLVFLGIGVAGIFLPVLPTTGPLLLSLWCFARGSRRLHDWVVNHRILGRYVHDLWVRGGLTRRSKRRAVVAMSAVMGLSAGVSGLVWGPPTAWWIVGGLALGWAVATTFILSRKTLEPVVVLVPENP